MRFFSNFYIFTFFWYLRRQMFSERKKEISSICEPVPVVGNMERKLGNEMIGKYGKRKQAHARTHIFKKHGILSSALKLNGREKEKLIS